MSWTVRDARTEFKWSDDKVVRMTRLWNDGMSASEIACAIGCPTRNAVIGKLHRLGLRRDPGSLRARCAEGARKSNRMQKAKSPPKPPKVKKERRAKLLPTEVHPNHKPDTRPIRCIVVLAARDLSLVALEPQDCRYPTGESPQGDHLFCGHQKRPGSSYCAGHHALICTPSNDKRKASLDTLERMIRRAA